MAEDADFLSRHKPLDALDTAELGLCDQAISRRLAAARIALVSSRATLRDRLKTMHDAERDRVWIPDDPKECSEEAVLKVRQSLEAMLKSIGNRRMMGVEAAMEDWSLAREWAGRHGKEGQLRGVLRELQAAMLERSDADNRGCPAHKVSEQIDVDPGPVPDLASRGSRKICEPGHEAIGADLVLEICRKQLLDSDEETRAKVEEHMKRADAAATASIQLIIQEYFEQL